MKRQLIKHVDQLLDVFYLYHLVSFRELKLQHLSRWSKRI